MKVIHSGGAQGADAAFGDIGTELGYQVLIHTFSGHTVYGEGDIVKHTADELKQADECLMKANEVLKRHYPPDSKFVQKLLQRDYYQVIDSQAVVAIAPAEDVYRVKGGTGWAVQMAIDMKKPVFLFDDGQTNIWYHYAHGVGYFVESIIPIITGPFAGIGSRAITSAGIAAIREVLLRNA